MPLKVGLRLKSRNFSGWEGGLAAALPLKNVTNGNDEWKIWFGLLVLGFV
jgi:hypothetical protein